MTVFQLVQQQYEEMTRTEKTVAICFMNHTQSFAFSTLEQAAELASTSTTSVIRFCRRLGFAGFKEFQRALQGDVSRHLDLSERLDASLQSGSRNALLERTLSESIRNLESTFSDFQQSSLEDATRRICGARRIFVFGMRESLALAHYAYTRLLTVRPEVYMLDVGYNAMFERALDLTPDDLCIWFLFHRYTAISRQMLRFVRGYGVQMLLITEAPFEEISCFADVILPCRVQTGGIKNSAVAPIGLLDYLCSAAAFHDPAKTSARFSGFEKGLDEAGILFDQL
ncbi:MAG: MurR/RpiR family transcriptional regulator [Clostridia bacterium]|nr:MurR/RpiR family transcriptional regulator [Clostridia bacterium]